MREGVPILLRVLPYEGLRKRAGESACKTAPAEQQQQRAAVLTSSHDAGIPKRVLGEMTSRGTTVRHGPSRLSEAWMLQVHSTTIVPFFITQGEGLLQPGNDVSSGTKSPFSESLTWMVEPT